MTRRIDFAARLDGVAKANVALVGAGMVQSGAAGTLASVVRGPAAIVGLLSRVRIAESLDQAREIARRLPAGESVVTPNGEWMGADWVRVIRGGGAQVGVLAREREIHALGAERETHEREVAALIARLEQIKGQIGEAELVRDEAQRNLYIRASAAGGNRRAIAEPAGSARRGGAAPREDRAGIRRAQGAPGRGRGTDPRRARAARCRR